MSTQIALAAERVERHLLQRCAARLVVAERVHVRRRVVRGDDDLGAERRVARRRVRVLDVPEDLRRREERVQLRLARERLREVDHAAGHRVLLSGRRRWCGESDDPAPATSTDVKRRAILGPQASAGGAMEGKARVNGVDLWYEVTGEGEPVLQIHGAGFGHFNFAPATPGARQAASGWSTSTCAATAAPIGRCSTTTWRSGRTTSPACWTRSTSRRRTSTAPRWAG